MDHLEGFTRDPIQEAWKKHKAAEVAYASGEADFAGGRISFEQRNALFRAVTEAALALDKAREEVKNNPHFKPL